MKFIVVLLTVFYACFCFSVLNVAFFDTNGHKYDVLYLTEKAPLNNTLTDEKILRCRNFTDKIVKDLHERPTEEELQDILNECILFLQQNPKLYRSKDRNYSFQSPPFENYTNQKHDFYTESHLTIEKSKKVKDKNTGSSENSTTVQLQRKQQQQDIYNYTEKNVSNSTEKPIDKPENQKTESSIMILNAEDTSWRIWNYLFGASGSTDNSRLVPVIEKNKINSSEKPTEKPEKQDDEFNSVILSSTNTSWSLWKYVFGVNDSTKSSNENRLFENLKRTVSSNNFVNSTNFENSTTEISAMWNIIFPGTKWCGSGNIAENDDDLGYFEDVDRCCRAHDKCSDIIKSGESKYNLTNTSPFTVLNCKCDDELYNCLSEIDSVASNTVGNTFFNILGGMCYMLDYPRICKKSHPLLGCLEYVIDKTAEKVYQWKPAKKYIKMPFTISG